MRKDLYEDLYTTEETHWWHKAKRIHVEQLIATHIRTTKPIILDVGCGTGKNMENLSHYGDVWGVDISKDALMFCKKRGIKQIKMGDVEHLPFPNNTFNIVCVLDVLEHTDENSSIKEIKRVLKNNGFVILTVPAFDWLWSKWDEILHHKRRYTKKQLENIFIKEDFEIKKITYIYSFLIIPSLIIRKIKGLCQQSYSSDFQINNPIVNSLLLFLSKLEQKWINRYDMPFGTSVLCIAQKRNEK
ncbi:MAG: class I SAM-dependent methyltransferase [bacterium]